MKLYTGAMKQCTFTLQDISWNIADKKNAANNQVNILYSLKTLKGNTILGRM